MIRQPRESQGLSIRALFFNLFLNDIYVAISTDDLSTILRTILFVHLA